MTPLVGYQGGYYDDAGYYRPPPPELFYIEDLHITSVATAVTPEPSSLLMLGSGLLGMAGVARRRLFKA